MEWRAGHAGGTILHRAEADLFKRYLNRKEAFQAAESGRWVEAFSLFEKVELTPEDQGNLMALAILQNRDVEAVQLLERFGKTYIHEGSLTHLAILQNCPLFLDAALSAGEDVHKRNLDETSLLEVAGFTNNLRCFDIVLKHGADGSDWNTTYYRNITDAVLERLSRFGICPDDSEKGLRER